MPAVERPGELGPPVLAVALGMAAVLLLLLLANSAISGALGSLFTKKHTAAKLSCRDLRGVFKGKVVIHVRAVWFPPRAHPLQSQLHPHGGQDVHIGTLPACCLSCSFGPRTGLRRRLRMRTRKSLDRMQCSPHGRCVRELHIQACVIGVPGGVFGIWCACVCVCVRCTPTCTDA